MSNRAGTLEDAMKSVKEFQDFDVYAELEKRRLAQEAAKREAAKSEKKDKKSKKSKEKDGKKDKDKDRKRKKQKKDKHHKSRRDDSSSSSDDHSDSDSGSEGRRRGAKRPKDNEGPSQQLLVAEGRDAANSLRVLLGYYAASKQDLRALFFSIDEGKAADLNGLQDAKLQSLLSHVLSLLRLAELQPRVFSLPKKWPHGDSIIKLLSQVLMEDPRLHTRAKDDYEARLSAERAAAAEAEARAQREEAARLNPPAPFEIPDVVMPSDEDAEAAGGRTKGHPASSRAAPAAPMSTSPHPAATEAKRARGPAMPPPEVLAAMAEGRYAAPGPAPAAEAAEDAAAGDAEAGPGVPGVFDDLVGPAPPPDLDQDGEEEGAGTASGEEIKRILRVIAEDPDADPYLILGVDKAAAPGEIKKRYWKLSLRVHPDKNPDDKRAVDAFQALRGAAEGLMDAEKRKQVDDKLSDKELWERAKRDAARIERENAWAVARGEAPPIRVGPGGRAAAAAPASLARDTWMTDMTQERPKHAKIEVGKSGGFATSAFGAGPAVAPAPFMPEPSTGPAVNASVRQAIGPGIGPTVAPCPATALPPSANRPKSMLERHMEQLEEEEKEKKRAAKAAKKAGKDVKGGTEKETWEGDHPWRPFDREKDLEIGGSKPKSALDMAKAAAGLSDRFKSGGSYR